MGYSLRTDQYRFICWMKRLKKDAKPIMVELYEIGDDFMEKENMADQKPELVRKLLAKTRELLR